MIPEVRRAFVIAVALAAIYVAPPAWAAAAASPTGLTAVALGASVDLAWQPVAGVTNYNVYRGTTATSVTTLVSPVGGVAATGFTDTSAPNGTTFFYVVKPIVGGAESGSSSTVQAMPRARSCSTGNPIVLENCYPGNSGWNAQFAAAASAGGIEGFTTATSINRTDSIGLKIQSAGAYHAEVYRSGYYGGLGARLFSSIVGLPASTQPACTSDSTTGLFDCSNWSASLTLTTTASWPSGVYLVHLVRDDNGSETVIPFVVRDDSRSSDLLYGVPFSTYEAYNNYGGKSLYTFNSSGAATVSGTARAVKVSFDRPFMQPRDTSRLDWYPRADYPLVSWLERSGDDVAYTSVTDLEQRAVGAHRAYMSAPHDEYWSAAMRSALEQARSGGTNLFFAGSNAVYWKIRFENGPNGGTNRVQVDYKTIEGG